MKDIRILEELLLNLENNLEEIELYSYEKYPAIKKFMDRYKTKHHYEINEYLRKEGRLAIDELDDLDFTDIIYIISKQINDIKDAVKEDLNKEYLNQLNKHERIGDFK